MVVRLHVSPALSGCAGATLHFDVELLSINEAPPPQNVFKMVDSDGDNQISREEIQTYLTQQLEQQKEEMPEEQMTEMLSNQVRRLVTGS